MGNKLSQISPQLFVMVDRVLDSWTSRMLYPLFQAISDRDESGTIVVTRNRMFRDWGNILNNEGMLGFVVSIT